MEKPRFNVGDNAVVVHVDILDMLFCGIENGTIVTITKDADEVDEMWGYECIFENNGITLPAYMFEDQISPIGEN